MPTKHECPQRNIFIRLHPHIFLLLVLVSLFHPSHFQVHAFLSQRVLTQFGRRSSVDKIRHTTGSNIGSGAGCGGNGGSGNRPIAKYGAERGPDSSENHNGILFGAASIALARKAKDNIKRKIGSWGGCIISQSKNSFSPHLSNADSKFGAVATQNLNMIANNCWEMFHSTVSLPMKSCSSNFLKWYVEMLETKPLLTKSVTSGVVTTVGDCAAQWIDHQMKTRNLKTMNNQRSSFNYNKRRGLASLFDGTFISGPIMHVSYDIFEKVIPVHVAGVGKGSNFAAISHVLADSLILDSLFVMSNMATTGMLEGLSLRDKLVPQIRKDYVPTIKASLVTSTGLLPIEFICFRCLPLSWRTLSMNFTSVIWDGVISFMAHRSR